jgi:hypothetical protein
MFLLRSRLSWLVVVAIALAGCKPTQLIVPASDPTPTSALWLQVDRPGQPLLNAYITSADPPAHAAAGLQLRITARADDPDGGVKDVQIWMTEQTWRTNPDGTETSSGPGLAGAPVASAPSQANVGDPAPASSSITHSLTPPTLTPPMTRRQYVIWARAVNFHGGAVQTQQLKVEAP